MKTVTKPVSSGNENCRGANDVRIQALVLTAFALISAPASAYADNVVTEWNRFALENLRQSKARQFLPRTVAMTEIAVFDALIAIEPRYAAFAYHGKAPAGASEVAAASQAAYRILAEAAPDLEPRFAELNTKTLAGIADGTARDAGVSVGEAAARAVIAARAGDSYDLSLDYTPLTPGPGVYEKTGPGPVQGSHLAKARGFGIAGVEDVMLPPPPSPDSAQFLRDFAEVLRRGDSRTAPASEDLAIAKFHEAPGSVTWSDITRQFVARGSLDLVDSARALALVEIAINDTLISGFAIKFQYNVWRPVTVAHAGGAGFGHPELAADAAWTPRIETPPFPEYPCMHCAVGAAGEFVLERLFPDPAPFSVTVAKVGTRSYRDVRAFAEEEAESRILAGVHYRWSLVAGDALGVDVGRHTLALLPKTP